MQTACRGSDLCLVEDTAGILQSSYVGAPIKNGENPWDPILRSRIGSCFV